MPRKNSFLDKYTPPMEEPEIKGSLYAKAERMKRKRKQGHIGYGDSHRLDGIADEIRIRIKITKQEIFNIGELLYEAKKILKDGFRKWIDDQFDFSYETAHNFMNVYKALFGHDQLVENVKSSILYKISAPSFPDDLREYLLTRGGLREITNRKLDDLIGKYKEGGIETVESIFEKVTESNLVFEQSKYASNVLDMGIGKLNELQGKLPPQSGMLPQANEVISMIWNTFADCIKKLEEEKKKVEELMRPHSKSYDKAVGDKAGVYEYFDEQTGEWIELEKLKSRFKRNKFKCPHGYTYELAYQSPYRRYKCKTCPHREGCPSESK